MRVLAIIQARMSSSRLPGKVLLDLVGEPMLGRVVNRTERAVMLDEVVIATTTKLVDEAIVQLCVACGWPYFRGSEDDVLDRYYRAAKQYQAEVVVRITSDCPLIEPEIVDWIVQEFLESGPVDYVSNGLSPRTFPRGLELEVIAFDALERAWREDDNPIWREHVTPYINRQPERFTLKAKLNNKNYSHMRWTVDTSDDLVFVRKIYEHFGHDRFSWREVIKLLQSKPELLEINRHVQQKMLAER
ncbi:glycosyltransferase family protein [Acidobacteria bacterium AH-259-D05]|nr:glycosyltransferase family protein [Acidobacteria bacterium AH-259-D05]